MLEVLLARAAHHEQVAGRRREVAGRAAAERADEKRPARAESDDRDERVVHLTKLPITVERDTVTPVAVVVEPDRAETNAVALLQRATDLERRGVGNRVAIAEPARQAGVVERAVVHAAASLVPCGRVDQVIEQGVAAEQPAAGEIDPRAGVERDPLVDRRRREAGIAAGEEGSLVGHRHGRSVVERVFVRQWEHRPTPR